MNDLRIKACVTDDATLDTTHDAAGDAASTPTVGTTPRRVIGNPAALDKSVFVSRKTREIGMEASIKALKLMDRLRFIRALDLAFHLYANRTLSAALAAANNLIKRLKRNGFVNAHATRVGGLRIYGISQRGVNFLRDSVGCEAKAHRSLHDVRNPEHRLWANLIVISAEARGLTAMTESEVLRYERKHGEVISDKQGNEQIIPRKFVNVANPREPGKRKGLTPDAMLLLDGERLLGGERVLIELDYSKRSAGRISDLRALVATCVGKTFFDGSIFSHLVVFTKERRSYTHITGVLRKKSEERVELASTYLKPGADEGVFDVYYHPGVADDKLGKPAQDFRCGRVQVQMLPDIREKGEGWYNQDWLPFAQFDEQLWAPMRARTTK